MRIILITIGVLFVFFTGLLTVKFWGKSLSYTEYSHSMLQPQSEPLVFLRPTYAQLPEAIKNEKNIYLDVTVTFDQKLVIPKRKWLTTEKPIRLFNYDEIKDDVILVIDLKEQLVNKKIIFNLVENAQAIHETFMYDLKKMGLDKGDNFIVTSQYEAPIKALKEIAPALVFGSTQPEILKIIAMQSMYILEAVTIRADVVIHPFKIHNHDFFNEEIMSEIKRRHKKIIVGPIDSAELIKAKLLAPHAIILNY